ncbi:hypothetical protein BDY21DRAFT_370642 [Lineolata rhizophorae]|uniref:Uncharacterized protein n=1 Tax=Lineolata rhizophorae TaxID=578093 RepID=A0A6A6P5A0_9PEZI|nr:hypothetical protein BDY21DRAFT_370642 [Lineolata rhizophorae]
MTSHTSRTPLSARSTDSLPPDYDPFDPPLDPIEMQSFTRPSWERSAAYAQASSPPIAPPPAASSSNRPRRHSPTHSSPEIEFTPAPPMGSPAGGWFRTSRRGRSMGGGEGGSGWGYVPLGDEMAPSSSQTPGRKSPPFTGGGAASLTPSTPAAPGSGPYRFPTDTEALLSRRAGATAAWKIHWLTPTMAVGLFIAGVVGAVAHHALYAAFDGQEAHDQLRMIRYGTALAFYTKACLVGSVVVSYRQRIWKTFREKAMTVSAIDGLFAVCEDPSNFGKVEMVKNAKVATFMALATWLIPIAAVLAPAALTSEIAVHRNSTTCPSVPTLNFNAESTYDFRDQTEFPGYSLSFYNTTDINAEEAGWRDYWDQPSKVLSRLAITSVYLQKAFKRDNAQRTACGVGWNCTYEISFTGPGYQCESLANGSDSSNDAALRDMGAPFTMADLAPRGKMIYIADVDRGEYKNPQVPTSDSGEPINDEWPVDLGVFKTEPVLWIGYVIDTGDPLPASSPNYTIWKTERYPRVFRCVHHHTNYTVQLDFQAGNQTAVVANRTFGAPVVDTEWQPDGAEPTPRDNWVRPVPDRGRYKLTAGYHALGAMLRQFLRGTIAHDSSYPLTRSAISETRLIEQATSYPIADLQAGVQSLYEDMLLTLLSEPHLEIANRTAVPCHKTRTLNVFLYHPHSLWIGYAIVVCVALACLAIGGHALWQNGVASDTLFSRIMATTRSGTLDRLSVGACLGGDPFPRELRRAKLRFGVLMEDEDEGEESGRGRGLGISPALSPGAWSHGGGKGRKWVGMEEGLFGKVEHCSFGTVEETKPIVKYGLYAGLKRAREEAWGEDEWEKKKSLDGWDSERVAANSEHGRLWERLEMEKWSGEWEKERWRENLDQSNGSDDEHDNDVFYDCS